MTAGKKTNLNWSWTMTGHLFSRRNFHPSPFLIYFFFGVFVSNMVKAHCSEQVSTEPSVIEGDGGESRSISPSLFPRGLKNLSPLTSNGQLLSKKEVMEPLRLFEQGTTQTVFSSSLEETTGKSLRALHSSLAVQPVTERAQFKEEIDGIDGLEELITTTTVVPTAVSIRKKTLPTPHFSQVKVTGRAFEDGESNQFVYPEWFESAVKGGGGQTVENKSENIDYDIQGNQEENPWREVTYFQNLPSRQPIVNEDTPETEMLSLGTSLRDRGTRRTETKNPPFYAASALDESAGLADVISRGRIDSVMYVYFGDKFNDYHKEEVAGRIIEAVGGVVAAIAHVLTVLGAAKTIRKGQLHILPVQLHLGFALLISNLLLLLAVHATEPLEVCATVAVVLHYLHLVIGAWLLTHTVQTYRALRHYINAPNLLGQETDGRPQMVPFGQRTVIATSTLRYCVITWASPFPFILMSYLASPDGYETQSYCWMSIEKGMLVSFIVPVFLLIGLNTLLVILSLRHLLALRKVWEDPMSLDEEALDEKTLSTGIRASAMLLPLLAIMWFLGVVALENPTSVFFQLAAAFANIALSWLVMYFLGDEVWPDICSCPFLQNQAMTTSHLSSSIEDTPGTLSVQPSQGIQLSFEPEPMSSDSTGITEATPGPSTALRWPPKNRAPWTRPGGNEIYELSHDAISTIYK